jgi:CRISPR-associated endonuclease/helicase Cas3
MNEAQWVETVALCPPTAAEALAAPLYQVKQWLADARRLREDTQADIEGQAELDERERDLGALARERTGLAWHGPEESTLLKSPRDLRPNDTLILPVASGDWEVFGHVPDDSPIDVAEAALFTARRELRLRLYPDLLKHWPDSPAKRQLLALVNDEDEDLNLRALRPLLSDLQTTGPEHLRPVLATLAQSDTRINKQWGKSGWVISGTLPKPAPDNDDLAAFTDEDDSASLIIRDKILPVTLKDHCAGVTRFAVGFAERCGLPAELVRDFELAGRFHDAGKADPRFQDWLYRNSGLNFTPSPRPLIAKTTPTSPEIIQQTREASGYPKGARHELLSVHLLQHDDALKAQAQDWELVLHLIASHHGRCRPFAPVVDDPNPATVDATLFDHPVRGQTRTDLERLDSGVADRFWRLTHKYGWWGLAYLEAIFRLADHRQSQLDAG